MIPVPIQTVAVESTTTVTFLEVRGLHARARARVWHAGRSVRTHGAGGAQGVPVGGAGREAVRARQLLGRRTAVRYLNYPSYYSSPCLQKLISAGNITAISSNSTVEDAQLAGVDVYFTDGRVIADKANYVAVAASYDAGTLRVRATPHGARPRLGCNARLSGRWRHTSATRYATAARRVDRLYRHLLEPRGHVQRGV